MNKYFEKLSRRERLALLGAAVVLLAGGVLYPLGRAAENRRNEALEELEAARSLLAGYRSALENEAAIREENGQLSAVLERMQGLTFERTGNDVMMEAAVIKILNQMAPDLGLEVSQVKSAPGSKAAEQMRFSVRGSGRYPAILNLFYEIEAYRPLIVIDQFNIAVQGNRRTPGQPGQSEKPGQTGRTGAGASAAQRRTSAAAAQSAATPTEPRMRLQMEIHINCRAAEGGRK